MTLADLTTEDINAAINRSLVTVEGQTYDEWARPYAWTLKPLATPPTVVYTAIDGKSYERSFEIEIEGESINAVLGSDRQRVESRTVWMPVEFALANFTENGEWVEREGKVFECGSYVLPIGPFTLTTEHADTAIAAGKAVPNDLEHVPTVLTQDQDGNRRSDILGETVLTRREGNAVFGKVRIPKWLHEKHGESALKVSATWHPSEKTLEGMALCLKPRITDAAVFATFAATDGFTNFSTAFPAYAEKIATEAKKAPAPAKPMENPTIKQRVQAFFAKLSPDQRDGLTEEELNAVFTEAQVKPAPAVTNTAGDPALLQRIKDLEERNQATEARFAIDEDTNAGLGFYADLLQAGKVTPPEKEIILATFSAARKADRTGANFSANAEGSSERTIRDLYNGKAAQFRLGPSLIDSGKQPEFSAGQSMGIFSGDFKEETK